MMDTAFSNFSPVDTDLCIISALLFGNFAHPVTLTEMYFSMGSALLIKLRIGIQNLGKLLKNAEDARKVLPIAFLLMLTFLAFMAWDGISSTRELLDSQAEVEHTHQVLHEMEGIETACRMPANHGFTTC